MIFNYDITNEDNGRTVLYILQNRMMLSRKLITKLKKTDTGIMVNGHRVFTSHIVNTSDLVTANAGFQEESPNVCPENIPLDILYEDDFLIAVNKPAGMVVHPTYNHKSNTLANGVAHYYQNNNIQSKISPVSRLDRGTSGIVLFSKNQFIQEQLCGEKAHLHFEKKYLALINGIFPSPAGVIDMNISRAPGSTIERIVCPEGQKAVTEYKTLEKYTAPDKASFSLIELILRTGRTHQIRVHCKYSGHAIVGDTLYFDNEFYNNMGMEHQALHSHKISFHHPVYLKDIEISCGLPADFLNAVDFLRT